MKRKVTAIIFTAVMCLCLFSGCSLSIKSPEKLMAPPKLTGDYQSLQDSFFEKVEADAEFVTPVNGEHKSAFVIDDFNSDGNDEAIVFYSSKDGVKTVDIAVFKKDGEDSWSFIKKISGAGSSVDCVIIDDLNGDGIKETTVGWNIFTLNKQFTVFESVFDSGKESFYELGSSPYNLITTADMDSNGKDELFFVYLDTNGSVPAATANVAALDENKNFLIEGKASIDGNISGYSAIYKDSTGGNTVMLVDAYKNEHDMITEVLTWDKTSGKLIAPLFDIETQTTTATWRNSRRSVTDIDSDGRYEIPVGVEIVGSSYVLNGELQEESLYYTRWSEFNGEKLRAEKYVLYNTSENYYLDIPSSWIGKITVTRLDTQLYFMRWDNSLSEHLGSQLLSLVSHSVDSDGIDGYKKLADYNNKSYEYCITADGEAFGIRDKNLIDGFNITVDDEQGGTENE